MFFVGGRSSPASSAERSHAWLARLATPSPDQIVCAIQGPSGTKAPVQAQQKASALLKSAEAAKARALQVSKTDGNRGNQANKDARTSLGLGSLASRKARAIASALP